MKLVMLIVPSERRDEIESALSSRDVVGYTEIAGVFGSGQSGLRLGSRAFPGTSSLILTMVKVYGSIMQTHNGEARGV